MMIHPYIHISFNKLKYRNVFLKVGQKDTPKKMLLKNNPRSQFQSQVGTCDKGFTNPSHQYYANIIHFCCKRTSFPLVQRESSKCKISPLGKDIVDCQTDDSRSTSKETKKGEKMISIEGTFVHNKKGNTKGVKEELSSTNYSYLRTIVRYSTAATH